MMKALMKLQSDATDAVNLIPSNINAVLKKTRSGRRKAASPGHATHADLRESKVQRQNHEAYPGTSQEHEESGHDHESHGRSPHRCNPGATHTQAGGVIATCKKIDLIVNKVMVAANGKSRAAFIREYDMIVKTLEFQPDAEANKWFADFCSEK